MCVSLPGTTQARFSPQVQSSSEGEGRACYGRHDCHGLSAAAESHRAEQAGAGYADRARRDGFRDCELVGDGECGGGQPCYQALPHRSPTCCSRWRPV